MRCLNVLDRLRLSPFAVVLLLLAACGGAGGGGGVGGGGGSGNASASNFPVGGTITGLSAGASLTLTNNGADPLAISTDGAFSFATELQSGAVYSVGIASAPALQACSVSAGSGTVSASVSSVKVTCIGPFSVGGTVIGLTAAGRLVLTNNGGDPLTLAADGPFSFATLLKPGSAYTVAIATQPGGEQCVLSGGSGTVTASNAADATVTCAGPTLQLLAGGLGGTGNSDGQGTSARFTGPQDVTVDGAGNSYVADLYNATIRKIDSDGNVTTLAGKAGQIGTVDGAGPDARFNKPLSITVDSVGNLYVVDAGVNTIRQISPAGLVRTLAGTPLVSGSADGTGAEAQFYNPSTIRWSANGSLYLTDNYSIRNITTGGAVTTLYHASRSFYGIDVSDPRFALLTDAVANSAVKLDWATHAFTTLAGGFKRAFGIAMAPAGSSSAGTVYVVDYGDFTVNAISPAGSLSTLAGYPGIQGYIDGTGTGALFHAPTQVSMGGDGVLWVADAGASTIRRVTAGGIVTTVAGQAAQAGRFDGLGAIARFENPKGLTVDSAGTLYVGEAGAIRKLTAAGLASTITANQGASSMAAGNAGTIYFVNPPDNSIMSVSSDGTVHVLAGSQRQGYFDGTGEAAVFNGPHGLACDSVGNVFVADTANAAIRKITPAGVVTTLAGSPGNQPDVDAVGGAAGFTSPSAVAVDRNGTLFVTDGNSIRRITADGNVTTVAGSQAAGSQDGMAAVARFNGPVGITVGPAGSVFVSDSGNNTIRQISADGIVTTLAGVPGHAGVQIGPLPASLNAPVGLAYVGSTLYVVDTAENSVLTINGSF